MKNRIPISRFWLTAFFYLLRLLSIWTFVGLLIWAAISREMQPIYLLGAAAGVFLVSGFLIMMLSGPVSCPLCRASLFAARKCKRNEKSPKLFGSYRIPLALGCLFLFDRLRCSFCGTSFRYTGKSRQAQQETQGVTARPVMRVPRGKF